MIFRVTDYLINYSVHFHITINNLIAKLLISLIQLEVDFVISKIIT